MSDYQYLQDLIDENKPENKEISQERVREILDELGYTLVPCRDTVGHVQISSADEVDGVWNTRWGMKDLEEAKFKVYRLEDGTYTVYGQWEKEPKGEYVPIIEAWPILEKEGYRIYWPYKVQENQYYLYRKGNAPQIHTGEGYHCFGGSVLEIWWSGHVDDQKIIYKPFVRGGRCVNTHLPEDVQKAFFADVGAELTEVAIETPVIHMPEPDWLEAGEYWIRSYQLPKPEAENRAKVFVKDLQKSGALAQHVLLPRGLAELMLNAFEVSRMPANGILSEEELQVLRDALS